MKADMKGRGEPRQRVRLKDIASELRVTEAAVSKALRDAADISPDLKQRVLECARKLNYQPNAAARGLATRRTYTVGLVLPDLMTSFFAEIAMGAARFLQPQGYTLMLANSDESSEIELREVDQLLARRVDGLLLASAVARGDAAPFERIQNSRTPLVLVDREFPGCKVDFAGADNVEVGRLATAHLASAGCRSIAHLACERLATGPARMDGYRRVLAEAGLRRDAALVVQSENNDQGGYEAALRLLAAGPAPDGIFCFSDAVAVGAEQAILEAGLRIPEDVAVVGAGNIRYSSHFRVPLTTVDMDSPAVGEQAAAFLLERIEGRGAEVPRLFRAPLRIVERSSTRPPGI
jgi:LacI family transcriptional regulator